MLEIRITAPELAEAINNLAVALTAPAKMTPIGTTTGATATNTISADAKEPVVETPAEPTPIVPVSAPQTVPTAPTVPTATYPTEAVPTEPTPARLYTLGEIAKAGTALIDAGKMDELRGLLKKYGVDVLTKLDTAVYPAFADDLRALGAQI